MAKYRLSSNLSDSHNNNNRRLLFSVGRFLDRDIIESSETLFLAGLAFSFRYLPSSLPTAIGRPIYKKKLAAYTVGGNGHGDQTAAVVAARIVAKK